MSVMVKFKAVTGRPKVSVMRWRRLRPESIGDSCRMYNPRPWLSPPTLVSAETVRFMSWSLRSLACPPDSLTQVLATVTTIDPAPLKTGASTVAVPSW